MTRFQKKQTADYTEAVKKVKWRDSFPDCSRGDYDLWMICSSALGYTLHLRDLRSMQKGL